MDQSVFRRHDAIQRRKRLTQILTFISCSVRATEYSENKLADHPFLQRIEKHAAGIKKQYEDLEAAAPKGEARAKSIETLFHAILSSDLPPAEKSLTRLTHEGREIIVAGAETAARTMASAVYFVLSTPGVLATLRAELGDLCATPGVYPDLGTLEKLPYLVSHDGGFPVARLRGACGGHED